MSAYRSPGQTFLLDTLRQAVLGQPPADRAELITGLRQLLVELAPDPDPPAPPAASPAGVALAAVHLRTAARLLRTAARELALPEAGRAALVTADNYLLIVANDLETQGAEAGGPP